MLIKGFLKRFAPFFIALALGLFVASFFVTVAAPSFRFNGNWRRHREYHRRLEYENQRLREENFRLRREAMERDSRRKMKRADDIHELVPPPPPLPPAPRRAAR